MPVRAFLRNVARSFFVFLFTERRENSRESRRRTVEIAHVFHGDSAGHRDLLFFLSLFSPRSREIYTRDKRLWARCHMGRALLAMLDYTFVYVQSRLSYIAGRMFELGRANSTTRDECSVSISRLHDVHAAYVLENSPFCTKFRKFQICTKFFEICEMFQWL